MDFERVLQALLREFHQQQIRYAAVGGFALGMLNVPRATMDVDFLIHRDDLEAVHDIMSRAGYQRTFQGENASHYRHADPIWVPIDVLYAFRHISLAMLGRAQNHPFLQGALTIKVLQPEDVIGLKIQGMANNPLRRTKELVDIESLMAYYGRQLDWARLQEYFDLFELGQEGRRLQERFAC